MKAGVDYIGVGCGALIINDQGEVLLQKRGQTSKNEAGFWSKPGGAVEYRERVEDAVIREIKEELGIDIELVKLMGFTNHIIEAENQHWISFNFLAKIVNGTPQNLEPGKIEEIGWFKLNELPEKLSKTTSEPIQQYIESL